MCSLIKRGTGGNAELIMKELIQQTGLRRYLFHGKISILKNVEVNYEKENISFYCDAYTNCEHYEWV